MLFAQANGFFRAYHDAVFKRFWNHELELDDLAAIATLPSSDPSGGHTYEYTAPQARALGYAVNPGSDGTVTLNSAASWTFDPNNRAVLGAYDAIGAAQVFSNTISAAMVPGHMHCKMNMYTAVCKLNAGKPYYEIVDKADMVDPREC